MFNLVDCAWWVVKVLGGGFLSLIYMYLAAFVVSAGYRSAEAAHFTNLVNKAVEGRTNGKTKS